MVKFKASWAVYTLYSSNGLHNTFMYTVSVSVVFHSNVDCDIGLKYKRHVFTWQNLDLSNQSECLLTAAVSKSNETRCLLSSCAILEHADIRILISQTK